MCPPALNKSICGFCRLNALALIPFHQIRSYILQPYQLVKDNRTNHESPNPDKVLNGEIDDFLEQSLYQIK